MLSENPYDTFSSKMSYIFIKFGSEWLRRHDSKRRFSNDSSLVHPFNRLTQTIFKVSSVIFWARVDCDWRDAKKKPDKIDQRGSFSTVDEIRFFQLVSLFNDSWIYVFLERNISPGGIAGKDLLDTASCFDSSGNANRGDILSQCRKAL